MYASLLKRRPIVARSRDTKVVMTREYHACFAVSSEISKLAVIESSIFHFADDSTRGVVDFEPFCNDACMPPDPLKVFLPLIKR